MLELYILYSVATLALNLSGWLGVSYFLLKYKKLDPLLAFSIGSLIFLIIFLFYGGVLLYSNIFNRIILASPLIVLLPFAIRFVKTANQEVKILLLLFVSLFALGILFQLSIPYYPIGSDWFLHYEKSSEYVTKGELSFLNGRPPVFNFLGAIFLTIFSNNFWTFQIISVFLSSLLIVPLYLIAKIFFKKTALITIIFVILNAFMIQNVIYTWPKNLTAFFVLFFIYFMIKNRSLAAVLPGALALYTSPISLFYIPAGYIYGYLKRNRNLIKSVLILGLIFLPIGIYSVLKTGSSDTTPFILYIFAVDGVESLSTNSMSEVLTNFLNTPPYYLVGIRLINFVMTVFPALLSLKFLDMIVSLPIIEIQKTVVVSQVPMIYHFMHSIPGALSTLVYAFSMFGLFRLLKENKSLFLLITLPAIFALIYWGWIKAGIINDLLHPTIPLLIMISIPYMKSKKLIMLALGLMIIEGLIFAYFYNSQVASFISTTMSNNPAVLEVDSINKVVFANT